MSHNEHRANSPSAHASVQDRAGLYIGIVALILAALALGMELTMSVVVDAKVKAGMAEVRGAVAQDVADAKASANTARQDARIALDKVEQTQTQLGAKGLVQPSTH